jgi:hypothetical protein
LNLDEVTKEISDELSSKLGKDLVNLLFDWKSDNHSVSWLAETVDRYIANNSDNTNPNHRRLIALWKGFRSEAIERIGGFTMNERLYHFSLFERFDNSSNEKDKSGVYTKLHASP